MDPFAAHLIATIRRADLAADADQSRLARASRECREETKPASRPGPHVRARRPATA